MTRIPQRDVNLARKMTRLGTHLLLHSQSLLDPSHASERELSDSDGTAEHILEDELLDMHSALREYRRKINPIEQKGQRA